MGKLFLLTTSNLSKALFIAVLPLKRYDHLSYRKQTRFPKLLIRFSQTVGSVQQKRRDFLLDVVIITSYSRCCVVSQTDALYLVFRKYSKYVHLYKKRKRNPTKCPDLNSLTRFLFNPAPVDSCSCRNPDIYLFFFVVLLRFVSIKVKVSLSF